MIFQCNLRHVRQAIRDIVVLVIVCDAENAGRTHRAGHLACAIDLREHVRRGYEANVLQHRVRAQGSKRAARMHVRLTHQIVWRTSASVSQH